ncbi:MAG: PhoH family protein [Alphaproteobacteria bacterium]|nr:PhoH family protein [Alphaproteobacteria bacterium]
MDPAPLSGERAAVVLGAVEDAGDGQVRLSLEVLDEAALREITGEVGQNLKVLARGHGVTVGQRGSRLNLAGAADAVAAAAETITQLAEVARAGFPLSGADVDQACRQRAAGSTARLIELYRDAIVIGTGRKQVHPRSETQRAYLAAIRDNDMVFGVGPAGTGKTYLAMAMALQALFKQQVRRIILCRPAVEAGEKLGFLPGDMVEKINPYLRPLFDALHDLLGYDRAQRLMAKDVIEVAPLAFMRGRTLSDAFVILDEAQNTTPQQMKMLLTRTGLNSRVVITGDPSQVDLGVGNVSGLADALRTLSRVEGIGVVRFSDVDVVRHPLVGAIIRAYDRADKERAAREGSDDRRAPRRPRSGAPPARDG